MTAKLSKKATFHPLTSATGPSTGTAALAVAGTVVLHNALNQVGLARLTGIGAWRGGHGPLAALALALGGLLCLGSWTGLGEPLLAVLAAAATTVVALASRRTLSALKTFPELAKLRRPWRR